MRKTALVICLAIAVVAFGIISACSRNQQAEMSKTSFFKAHDNRAYMLVSNKSETYIETDRRLFQTEEDAKNALRAVFCASLQSPEQQDDEAACNPHVEYSQDENSVRLSLNRSFIRDSEGTAKYASASSFDRLPEAGTKWNAKRMTVADADYSKMRWDPKLYSWVLNDK